MEVNSGSPDNKENNVSDGASSTPRSAADSVANAFSNQLAQVQADLAASKAYALSVEEELLNLKAETAIAAEKQSQEISKIKIDSEIKSQAISSGLIDLDCLPLLEPDPKVFEQYQHVVIHSSLRRDGVNSGMDWYCPTRT